MATRVGAVKIWMTLFDQPTPKTPVWWKILGPILNVSWVIVIFVWKFQNFRYHGNRGWSDTNFTYTVKSADPENPIWRKNLDYISYTSWVIADFLIKFTNFCYHGNKGGSSENLNDSVWSANPNREYNPDGVHYTTATCVSVCLSYSSSKGKGKGRALDTVPQVRNRRSAQALYLLLNI